MGKVVKDIRMQLSEAERVSLGNEIAEHVMRCEAIEDQKRAVTSDLTSALKNERKAYRSKAKALRDGHTFKPIDCEEVPNFERNEVAIKRCDTGEQVDLRAMRPEERQTAIDFPGGKPAPEVSPKKGGKKGRVGAQLSVVPPVKEDEPTVSPSTPPEAAH